MRTDRREVRDWFVITVIILIGFLCLFLAGSVALRFAPSWQLSANMDSYLDPNSDYLTNRPAGLIEPVDQSILTAPFWLGLFQTPGVTLQPPTPLPTNTNAPIPTATAPIVPSQPNSTSTTIPTSTVIYIPASPTPTSQPPQPPTRTATPRVDADLQVTKDDGVLVYSPGSTLNYTIIVTNHGPANVTGAVITDNFPAQLNAWGWKCTAQNGGATGCDSAVTNHVSFSDTVNLPSGASIVYSVRAQVLLTVNGDLVNTVQVAAPAPYKETDPTNNIASDVNQLAAALPIGAIGDTPDGIADVVASGNSITFQFSAPLTVHGHAGYDLVYYELSEGAGITMDLVILEIGNGINWYPVFYWGDDQADANSSLDIGVLGGTETDNRDFSSPPPGLLYNGTGIQIELDGMVPPGIYPYFRILTPSTAADMDGCEVDAIVILP